MDRHIVVKGRVHCPGSQPIGDCPQAEQRESVGNGEAEQRSGGHSHAHRCNQTGAKFPNHPAGQQAGNDGADGNDHGDDTRIGDGRAQFQAHDRPCGAQQGVGQTQADERQVDDC